MLAGRLSAGSGGAEEWSGGDATGLGSVCQDRATLHDADVGSDRERWADPADGRGSRIALTDVALAGLPGACAALLQGNRESLDSFWDEEAAQFVALLDRLIANIGPLGGVGSGYKNHTSTDFGTVSGM